ncbi:MAG: hypothetical protein ACPGWR_15960 [Ardenticatenaceae bacterium]
MRVLPSPLNKQGCVFYLPNEQARVEGQLWVKVSHVGAIPCGCPGYS